MRLPSALPLLAGLLAVYLIAPFLAGIGQAGLADWRGVDAGQLFDAAAVSVGSATLATVLVAIGGVPLGYVLARRRGRGFALLGFVVQLPLALPPLASGTLLLFLVGYASPLGRLTDGALTDSFAGIVLAEAFVAAPFLIVAARSAFMAVDPVLEDVAATLGHGPWSVFCRVSLALSGRAIAAGLLLTWLRGFGEFGATVMVAYHPYSLPVFTYVAFGSEGLPAMLPILLPTVVLAVLVMAASQFFLAPPAGRRRAVPQAAPLPVRPRAAMPTPLPPAQTLAFSFRWEREGFCLDVAWRTTARSLCILGPSGSGKSATLRLLAGLDTAAEALLSLGGVDLSRVPPEARGIAYVPQSYALLPHLSVARQIGFAVGSDPGRAAYWIGRLGLSDLLHRRPAELSLGQQQRVALARALARDCRLLLLDEPFSALDAPRRGRLRRELAALQREIAATTVLVTHDPAEALMLAEEVLLLDGGRVLQAGPAEAVFLRPVSETAARLLGAENIAFGQAVAADRIDVGGAEIVVCGPALARGPVGFAVRPEDVRVGSQAAIVERRGRRSLVRVGAVVLEGIVDGGGAGVRVDPAGVQVWQV